jgi:chromosome segregation ATPase
MKLPNKVLSWGLVAGFALSLSIATGCTKHPSEGQLRALEETKQAALSAEQTLEQKKREKSDLERQLEQKKRELQKAKDEKEAVKRRLGL